MSLEHHHVFNIPLGDCSHPVEHGRYGFVFGCLCGQREHRWLTVRLPVVADRELWWLQPMAVSAEERAAMVAEEREACKVRAE